MYTIESQYASLFTIVTHLKHVFLQWMLIFVPTCRRTNKEPLQCSWLGVSELHYSLWLHILSMLILPWITQYDSSTVYYIGIAMVFLFLLYIRKFNFCSILQSMWKVKLYTKYFVEWPLYVLVVAKTILPMFYFFFLKKKKKKSNSITSVPIDI